jgi:large subunit ribosomal protein L30
MAEDIKVAAEEKAAVKASAAKKTTAKTAAAKTTAAKTAAAKATDAKTTTKKTSAAKETVNKAAAAPAEKAEEPKKADSKKKAAAPKYDGKYIKVTLVKSTIGCKKNQIDTVKALGLNKIRQSNIIKDNAATRGMINKVSHLVCVSEVKQEA